MRRWIAHLDMDAFFASVELLRYPELRGQPVVVGGGSRHPPLVQPDGTRRFARLRDYAGRGVATTATYEARAFGVHSGIGLMKAAALAPDAVLLPTDFDEYKRMSRLFKQAVLEHVAQIDDRGIDEIYFELTDLPGAQDAVGDDPHGGVRAIAARIQQAVQAATGLSCSIGLSPNKLLSKICSDLEKPRGLTVITEADIAARIWPLPAKRINGIGPKANAKLDSLGLRTIGDLAAADPQGLIERFGRSYGSWLTEAAHGRDDRPLSYSRDPKSISRETTFERDLHAKHDREELGALFTRLCERLADDLKRKGVVAKSVGVKLRQDDFRIVTRELTMDRYTADAAVIRRHAGLCLKRMPLERRFRLLGVRAGHLLAADQAAEMPAGQEEGQLALPF
ncbi:DNA-directed DNA polymerase [Methyloversatilis universalis FAM5]|uniref:DNA polymerase IV n=1 Tax=Methyloversatilis universalis (strain ATCC BAA-1314 / DSM 25237 / JCM 13912 / CCUG 52030 / FAM5) TaxID=1000565 RepID=F5REQ9_METUF|nr:DNA polymerase IV [Methyloversatilis universalis]EGK71390.1 DNA-directed DNA polymerase [Methyloversatilis universalis FAM5]